MRRVGAGRCFPTLVDGALRNEHAGTCRERIVTSRVGAPGCDATGWPAADLDCPPVAEPRIGADRGRASEQPYWAGLIESTV